MAMHYSIEKTDFPLKRTTLYALISASFLVSPTAYSAILSGDTNSDVTLTGSNDVLAIYRNVFPHQLDNEGQLSVANTGSFTNLSELYNYGTVTNFNLIRNVYLFGNGVTAADNNATVNNYGTFLNDSAMYNYGRFRNYAPDGNLDNSYRIYNYHTIDNYGIVMNQSGAEIYNADGSAMTVHATGSLNNFGSVFNGIDEFDNTGTATLDNQGSVVNYESLTNHSIVENSGSVENRGNVYSNGEINNHNNFNNTTDGSLYNDGNGVFTNLSGATLTNQNLVQNGSSTIDSATFDNAGVVDNQERLDNYASFNNAGVLINQFDYSEIVNHAGAVFINEAEGEISNSGGFTNGTQPDAESEGGITPLPATATLNNIGAFNNSSVVINYSDIENNGIFNNRHYVSNRASFDNYAVLINNNDDESFGFFNTDRLVNHAGATINNLGQIANGISVDGTEYQAYFTNNGEVNNRNELFNSSMGLFFVTNGGVLNNFDEATIRNENFFSIGGDVSDTSYVNNEGIFINFGRVISAGSSTPFDNQGQLVNNATFENFSTLNNDGVLGNQFEGEFYNTGTVFNNDGPGVGLVTNSSTFYNGVSRDGQESGGSIENHKTFVNSGTLFNSSEFNNYDTFTNTLTGRVFIDESGVFTNHAGATLTNAQNFFNGNDPFDSATLNNHGNFINDDWFAMVGDSVTNNTGSITNHNLFELYGGELNNDSEFINADLGRVFILESAVFTNHSAASIVNNHNFFAGSNPTHGMRFNNAGNFTNNDWFATGGAESVIDNSGSITNNLLFEIYGTVVDNSGSFVNSDATSQVYNTNEAVFNNLAEGEITNSGEFLNGYNRLLEAERIATLNNAGKFYNEHVLTNYSLAAVTNAGSIINNGSFNNHGLIRNHIGGRLTNNGELVNGSEGINTTIDNRGELINNQRITNHSGSVITNSGHVTAHSGSQIRGLGDYIQTAGVTTMNGVMTQRLVDIQGGILKGTGTITSEVSVNGTGVNNLATLAPGNSIGELTIDGNYTQGQYGVLKIEFNGTSIDKLSVTGLASLDGSVEFDFTGNQIRAGQFTFLEYGNYLGQFESAFYPTTTRFNFGISYDADSAKLLVSAVPEPSTWLMFGAGLGLMGFVSRRRQQK